MSTTGTFEFPAQTVLIKYPTSPFKSKLGDNYESVLFRNTSKYVNTNFRCKSNASDERTDLKDTGQKIFTVIQETVSTPSTLVFGLLT